LEKRSNLFALPAFKAGLFEMQDENSQLIALALKAEAGDLVLDFCAGSGGKTLAFAHQLKGTGQIFLHDIRPRALLEAKKRLRRAGIQNAQIAPDLKNLKKNFFSRLLLDVPCSGSGTIRRNPDMKWKFSPEALEELVQKQREIFQEALPFLKTGGHLLYATCSLFQKENEQQTAYFLQKYPLEPVGDPVKFLPESHRGDGFFGQLFKKL
ncbi:MAG: RsmB/NOP family class I SAM-dependent RNA methyltransferase, partial [Parachlamydiales bacterium]